MLDLVKNALEIMRQYKKKKNTIEFDGSEYVLIDVGDDTEKKIDDLFGMNLDYTLRNFDGSKSYKEDEKLFYIKTLSLMSDNGTYKHYIHCIEDDKTIRAKIHYLENVKCYIRFMYNDHP